MGETAWRRREGPDHVKTPTSKRLGWRYSDEAVSWNMRLFAEELTILASAHEVLHVGHCGGPPETGSVCFPHQRSLSRMVAADAIVDLPQYVVTIFLCDALHENP
jgi:hypothetical protein